MMNLSSRKVMCKRQKQSSACDEIKEGEDFISKLPNALLIVILSFLPEADAVRTCILSNRWKYIWAFLPNLSLVMPFCWSTEEANQFHDFVDRILALRVGLSCRRFYLYCSKNCDYNRVYDCLCTVVKNKVEKIDLRFPADRFIVKFCWDLFRTSYTLVQLTLRGEFVLDVPEAEVLFPCLKKLNLISIAYVGDQVVTNLISGCPLLQELFVERQLIGHSDNMEMFKVTSHSLRRLRMSFASCVDGDYKVVIDAPNLKYMSIVDFMSAHITFTRPFLLFEAYIKTRPDINTEFLLPSLSSVRILNVTNWTLMALHNADVVHMPVFNNLVKLVIGLDPRYGWILLADLFELMPKLEHLTLSDGIVPFPRAQHFYNIRWDPSVEAPHCLRFAMKEIVINNREAITQEEFPLIRYLLRHSNQLETLSINAHKIRSITRERLLKLYRGSALCRIELI
ncbi:hypothetical protein LXL04_032741 [Taraxacum kok-saghyz]